ncbi:YDG/SRA domain-containing protein [Actinoplanes missouriensis]|uniref:YDG/SRA domain-containing protein n=1 Tax=Actinoplanes missouriensis TaxID=1866 RepID=UPI0033F3D999
MNFDEIENALEQIRRDRPRGAKSVHQPATLIWAAQRATRGESRVAPWRDVRGQLIEIIMALGDKADGETVANRILGLRNSPIVDFQFSGSAIPAVGVRTDDWLDKRNPLVGLAGGAYETLADQSNFERFATLAIDGLPKPQGRLVREYFGIFAGYGEVPGIPEGTTFRDRAELVKRRVHRNGQAGIFGNREGGAESVVVSGGYEDDEDYDDFIVYTGHGGRDQRTGKQVEDQSFDASGNAALVTSHVNQVPVRVIRRAEPGYRYDGLFQIEKCWQERGRSGFQICRYRLVKAADIAGSGANLADVTVLPRGNAVPGRKATTVDRIMRLRALSRALKELHQHRCQVCDIRLLIAGRGYAEGAHVRPVGRPHEGTDTADNLLCLCPNCHVLFDNGEIRIQENLDIVSDYPNRGKLRIAPGHEVNVENLAYHRRLFPST